MYSILGGGVNYKDRKQKSSYGSGHGHKDLLSQLPKCKVPQRLKMILDIPPVEEDEQFKHAWNGDDRWL